jgi:hypothetical protein
MTRYRIVCADGRELLRVDNFADADEARLIYDGDQGPSGDPITCGPHRVEEVPDDTDLYLVCEDHDPPLKADDESGQHLYDLDQIRADIANRERIIAALDIDYVPDEEIHFRRSTARFLAAHPKCRIGIIDEYGKRHPVNPEEVPG